jgi:hypothetical protein
MIKAIYFAGGFVLGLVFSAVAFAFFTLTGYE